MAKAGDFLQRLKPGRKAASPLDVLRASPLFDAAWYREMNPDLRGKPIDAAKHYLEHGAAEGRNPSPLFDTKFYLAQNPDVAASGINPAVHYVLHGQKEGRSPHPEFRCSGAAISKETRPSFELELPEVERRVAAYFAARSSANAQTFQAAAYARAYPDVAFHLGANDPAALIRHWQTYGFKEGRTPFGHNPYTNRKISATRSDGTATIEHYGFFNAQSGMGTAARGYLSAMRQVGLRVSPINVVLNAAGLYDTDPETRHSPSRKSGRTDGNINLFHINADMVNKFFVDDRLHLLDGNYNIGFWAWELAHFCPDWATAFGALDEIWVPSEFCREAISASSPVPVFTIPHVVKVGHGDLSRSYFRIRDDVFVFGSIFDIGSAQERKNPEATIRAFIEAFGDRDDVLLAIKYHQAQHDNGGLARLHALAEGRRNIRFFGRTFSELEIASFKSLIDCFVSSHRSEGFGLNIAEALSMEKPVIATNYSGNVDFMDEQNSFPVNYRLVEIRNQVGPYPVDALWAEATVGDLIDRLRFVVDNPAVAAKRARVGHERVSKDYTPDSIGRIIIARLRNSDLLADMKGRPNNRGTNYTFWLPEIDGPKISVVVPVYNIEAPILLRCIYSVIAQTYENWELILRDDGSQRNDTLTLLKRVQGVDPRIKVSFGRKNEGIAAAANAAIALSSGEFIGFLDNDDELAPDALLEMAAAIKANQDADMLYSDEDKIDFDGKYCDAYFKPGWSPEHLESVMYLLHFLVVRRSTVLAVGGLRAQYSGAQDYDLALQVSRVARRIVHVAKILYHWRKMEGSASAKVDAKPYGLQKAREALQAHLEASGRQATALPGLLPGIFRVRDAIPNGLPVTLMIFTDNRTAEVSERGKINLFDHFVNSIMTKTNTACALRILAIDNGNLSERQHQLITRHGGEVISYTGQKLPFNFSKKVNFALSHVKTEFVILLNDDMEVISADWLDALVELAARPAAGVVGARLLYPDGRIQHCGIVLGINDGVAHVYHQWPGDHIGYNGYTHLIRNYLAVTGACMATRMSLFDEVGGFDEKLAIDYNDIDFCLRAHAVGYRNIYTPFSQLYHFEGTTQTRSSSNQIERALFVERWRDYVKRDPYYNPNLTKSRLDFSSS